MQRNRLRAKEHGETVTEANFTMVFVDDKSRLTKQNK